MFTNNTNKTLKNFEMKFNLKLVVQEAGFDQIVTGFIPQSNHMFLLLDDNLSKDKPENAYKYCDILAVNGYDKKAYNELTQWIKQLNLKNLKIGVFHNNNKGIQAEENGRLDYILMEEK